ncbi:MAG: alpha-amylase family glycosyl hydrolase [Promethearchaeota archaeon]
MELDKKKWPRHPKIYQINTWVWLDYLSRTHNQNINLMNVPEGLFDLDLNHFDAIWLMGVWERSPKGKEIALTYPGLQEEYKRALNDFKSKDVVGSPYCIYSYNVDYHLGGNDGLAVFRENLDEKGVKLILDYVPNHVARDSPYLIHHPEIFIRGNEDDLKHYPYDFFEFEGHIYAHGRDPNFPAWTDTAQINAFAPEAREQTIDFLKKIAKKCDGVRCDMAMLLMNKIFERTWGHKTLGVPEKDFWEIIIPEVKEEFPDFLFIAEVYWDLEWELMQQGFDYCYDKKLYDRMKYETAKTVRSHLYAEWDYQKKLLRFIENHDEERAITALGREKSMSAAILILTIPGAKLIHEGQMKGYKIKLPLQLGRRQMELEDQELLEFYLKLLNILPQFYLESGIWSMCRVLSVGDFSNNNLIAYCWNYKNQLLLTVINFSPYFSKGHVVIDNFDYDNYKWEFNDLLKDKLYVYDGINLSKYGLYVELNSWQSHIFEVKKMKD